MKQVIALVDYRGVFGTKYFPHIYRTGMDKDLLKRCFYEYSYDVQYVPMFEAHKVKVDGIPIIYTSQEDSGYKYKSFIEDVVLFVEKKGAVTLPSYSFLRATNNKVLMEMLRGILLPKKYSLKSYCFGSLEELIEVIDTIDTPCILKTAGGSVSRGVHKADTKNQLYSLALKYSRSKSATSERRDLIRSYRHKGYTRESRHREKFIVQEFLPGLYNDWKVLVFFDQVYVLRRQNRPGDFRASGSGLFSFDDTVDSRLLEAGIEIRKALDIPIVSLDLAFKDDIVILFEFQGVHFGTSTLEKSPYYYTKSSGEWQKIVGKSILEDVYAKAIVDYLEKEN